MFMNRQMESPTSQVLSTILVFCQTSFDELCIRGETLKEKQIVYWDIRQYLIASLLVVFARMERAG